MGIVNVTPDSFSDGGKYFNPEDAVHHALQLEREGADLLDFGAESTRPGSEPVSAAEQLKRLEPVLAALKGRVRLPLSVDTSSAEVAEQCIAHGVSIINDVSAFERDPDLASLCSRHGLGVVLMHMRGVPGTMQRNTQYADLLGEITEYLGGRVAMAEAAGIARERIVVDPGIGFGKSFDQNHVLLANLDRFAGICAGVLAGPSRKAFTGQFSGKPPSERQIATAAAVALARTNGADVLRVHDVALMREVCDFADQFREINGGASR